MIKNIEYPSSRLWWNVHRKRQCGVPNRKQSTRIAGARETAIPSILRLSILTRTASSASFVGISEKSTKSHSKFAAGTNRASMTPRADRWRLILKTSNSRMTWFHADANAVWLYCPSIEPIICTILMPRMSASSFSTSNPTCIAVGCVGLSVDLPSLIFQFDYSEFAEPTYNL